MRDRIRIHLPEGYRIEAVPPPVHLDTEWGTFTSSCNEEDGIIVIDQEIRTNRFREAPDRFDDFRTFIRAVNKAYDAQIVLVRQ